MNEINERDVDALCRILDYCDRISEAQKRYGARLEDFMGDADYRDVIKMNLFQIGENANLLSDSCKEDFKEIPWRQVIGLRNVIAHAYIKVDDQIIWNTVKKDIPELIRSINQRGIV